MGGKVRVRLAPASRVSAGLCVAGVFAGDGAQLTEALPAALARAAAPATRLPWLGDASTRWETAVGAGDGRLILLGLGQRSDFDHRALAKLVRRALAAAGERRARSLRLAPPEHPLLAGASGAETLALRLSAAAYRFADYLDDDPPQPLRTVSVLPPAKQRKPYREGFRSAEKIAAGLDLARDLGNRPPNVATPAWLAGRARELARRHQMTVTDLRVPELKRRRMGGILAVGQGSRNPPRLVRLRWGRKGPRVALVGKGVTFDTGGISIKPAASMEEMKFDKCGACTVLGILEAAAGLKLAVRLDAYLPLVENMPDAGAYRPSDIVRCYNGKTVEIVNTDAEGRMILADALAWAAKARPDYLLEMSTLTGAAVVALGQMGAGLYTPDDDLAEALLQAAETSGERLWRMPLWPEFTEAMKGNHADLKNTGGRWGGANTAAAFLSQFVGSIERWAHVDLAGPAYTTEAPAGQQSGATGYGVTWAVRWLRSLARETAG